MESSVFLALLENAALLVVLLFVSDYLSRNVLKRGRIFQLVIGGVLGILSIAVMLFGWELPGGGVCDTRTIVLGVGTLFYGPLPGVIGAAIAAAFRLSLGGAGTLGGVLIIVMPVVVGALWRRRRPVEGRDLRFGFGELYLFGLLIHALELAIFLALPWPGAGTIDVLGLLAVPVMVIFPLATVLIGLLMMGQGRRLQAEQAARRGEVRFAAFSDRSPGLLYLRDRELRYVYVNQTLVDYLGHEKADLLGLTPAEALNPESAARQGVLLERALAGEAVDAISPRPTAEGKYYRSMMFPVPVEGEETLLGGMTFDVTEQVEAQLELQRQTERVRGTMERAVQAMGNLVERRDPEVVEACLAVLEEGFAFSEG